MFVAVIYCDEPWGSSPASYTYKGLIYHARMTCRISVSEICPLIKWRDLIQMNCRVIVHLVPGVWPVGTGSSISLGRSVADLMPESRAGHAWRCPLWTRCCCKFPCGINPRRSNDSCVVWLWLCVRWYRKDLEQFDSGWLLEEIMSRYLPVAKWPVWRYQWRSKGRVGWRILVQNTLESVLPMH